MALDYFKVISRRDMLSLIKYYYKLYSVHNLCHDLKFKCGEYFNLRNCMRVNKRYRVNKLPKVGKL
jgi:hypothetical protein